MRVRRPAPLTSAILNRVLRDNEPLAGDLLEEFESGRSQWWLFLQVTVAAFYRLKPNFATLMQTLNTEVVGAGLLVLVSFEAVLVANVFRRLIFGPPLPRINGYLHLLHQEAVHPAVPTTTTSGAWLLPLAVAMILSPLMGLIASRYHYGHRPLSLVLLITSVFLLAMSNIDLPFASQLVITTVFIVGLIAGGASSLSPFNRGRV
jgi:hypothetical protein